MNVAPPAPPAPSPGPGPATGNGSGTPGAAEGFADLIAGLLDQGPAQSPGAAAPDTATGYPAPTVDLQPAPVEVASTEPAPEEAAPAEQAPGEQAQAEQLTSEMPMPMPLPAPVPTGPVLAPMVPVPAEPPATPAPTTGLTTTDATPTEDGDGTAPTGQQRLVPATATTTTTTVADAEHPAPTASPDTSAPPPAPTTDTRTATGQLRQAAAEAAPTAPAPVEGGPGTATLGPAAPASAASGTTTAAEPLTHVGRQVAPTLVRYLSTAGPGPTTHRITLQLHPVDLGEVRATLVLRDGAVRVTLTAGEAARELLRHDHPLLQQVLERTGAERVEIAVRALPGTAGREPDAFSLPTGTGPGDHRETDHAPRDDREGHRPPGAPPSTQLDQRSGDPDPTGAGAPDVHAPARARLDVTV